MQSRAVPSVSASKVVQASPGKVHKGVKLTRSISPNTLPATSENACNQFQRDLVALIPHLRAFSRSLCFKRDLADDLAQDALMKAWDARESFKKGTNLKAWLFTILRNTHYSHYRRAWRESQLDAGQAEQIEAPDDEQGWAAELCDTARALRTLPDAQRDAVILVGAGGFTYEAAAKICNTNSGTMKSRVARGRAALLSALESTTQMRPQRPEHAIERSADILARMNVLTAAHQHPLAHG